MYRWMVCIVHMYLHLSMAVDCLLAVVLAVVLVVVWAVVLTLGVLFESEAELSVAVCKDDASSD